MAADDDDDMEWADYEEQVQHPKSDEDEGDAEYEFPELEMGFDLRSTSPRFGAPSVAHQDTTQTALPGRPCQLPSRMPVLREVQRAGGHA